MTPAERLAGARNLLDSPLFHELVTELETNAINACVYADPTDDAKRAAYAAEVRAIRKFRSKLNLIVEEANADVNSAPA